MHEPEHIIRQARTRYDNKWRDWLLSPPTAQEFSLDAPSSDFIARNGEDVGAWKKRWSIWQQDHPAAVLVVATKQTRIGPQEVFTHVRLDTASGLASVDDERSMRWERAAARWDAIVEAGLAPAEEIHRRAKPVLRELMTVEAVDFRVLIRATEWFRQNPASGLTVRQVPVLGMHTKWLKKHRRFVLALLGIGRTAELAERDTEDDLVQEALDALGLRALPPQIDVIITDPVARKKAVGGLRSLRAPLPEVAALPLEPSVVVVVENKESALLVQDHEGVIVVHSLGNHLNALVEIPWFAGAHVIYWGDLDRAGITLLSRARAYLGAADSVLMDRETLERFVELANSDTSKADSPGDNLTPSEADALAALNMGEGDYLRLEQERLPVDYLMPILNTAIVGGLSAVSATDTPAD